MKWYEATRTNQAPKLKITKRERVELIAEGFITLAVVFLLYLGMLFVFSYLLDRPMLFGDTQRTLRETWQLDRNTVLFYRHIFTGLTVIFGAVFIGWRLMRRYNQLLLYHVLDELYYIAQGNLDYRIPFQLSGDMNKVVQSINKLVESTAQAMAEERRIEQSKDELVTSVSHDLRTPLTSLIGYLGLVDANQYQTEAERQRYTRIAYNKANQLKHMVDDLFEYTTVRQANSPLQKKLLSVEPFLEQIAADYELEAGKQQLTIQVSVQPNPLVVSCDPEKMARVFDNLLGNAIKYGKGGTCIWLSAQEQASGVVLRVVNDGPAIPEEALAHVFERFYRADYARPSGGSGLGLAIAQSIVERHGGRIFVESQPQKTQFVIELPKS